MRVLPSAVVPNSTPFPALTCCMAVRQSEWQVYADSVTRSGATACNSPGFGLIQLIPKSHACPCALLCMSLCMQGGTIGYAMLAGRPEYNEKVSVLIQMGPVWYIQYFQAPFLRAMAGPRNPEVRPPLAALLVGAGRCNEEQ